MFLNLFILQNPVNPVQFLCFAIAVRAFSMTVLENICRKIPEFQPELRHLIEEHIDRGSAAFSPCVSAGWRQAHRTRH